MEKIHRLSLVFLVLSFAQFWAWLPLARHPKPERSHGTPPDEAAVFDFSKDMRPKSGHGTRPIEAVFDQICSGMPESALSSIMAPYKEEFTGHYQWRMWSENETFVEVTVMPDGGLFMPAGPWRVKEKRLLNGGHRMGIGPRHGPLDKP